ncbi:AsmA family protein [Bordetella sp. 02P26C-1]|uniref:AsmA family protein n=1 Tax=Bordetella sp. 02P26C-1 TaxID=2683195 RepID=UPI001353F2EF|nr:AsmA family protein [Bordetella sp. 02P26C-1]MVW77950.1 AsmA family protein [Bordetella sp. 02P26C-1]
MTRTKKLLIGLGAAIVVLVAAVVIAVALFDWNSLKPTINEKVSKAIGRPFAINGDLTVQWRRPADTPGWRGWVPWPYVTANDVTVANTDWGQPPRMASLKRAEFTLSPLALLKRYVVIRQIQLTGADVHLERLKDGRTNWEFAFDEGDGEPSPWLVDIDQIGFDQGNVSYRDEILSADLRVQIDPLGKPIPYAAIAGDQRAEGKGAASVANDGAQVQEDYAFGLKVEGSYKKQAVKGEGKIGGVLALRDATRPFPVQADVSIGPTRIAGTGTLTDPASLGALDLRLELSGKSMSDLYPLIGVTLPDTPAYATDGHLVALLQEPDGAVYHYRGFNGRVGRSDLHGDLTYRDSEPRPKLSGELTSRQLRMVDLGPLIGVDTDDKKNAGKKDEGKKGRQDKVLPTHEFRTNRWRDMDANVALKAERIIYDEKLPITKMNVHFVLENGHLTLDPLRFGFAGGTIDANIKLNGAKTPMDGQAKVAIRGLRLKQLFPDVEAMQRALGQLNGDIALTGTGNSVAALLGTGNGDTRLIVNDGVISRGLMEIAGLNVGSYVVTKLFGDEEVKINCAAADLQMKQGVMTPRVFIFDTENAIVQVHGDVNFKNETLDLDIDPESKGIRIFSLRSPLYVKGTFADPDAGVQVLPLAARGAGAVALGVLLTPVASLLALVAPSSGEDDAKCGTLMKQMREPEKKPSGKGEPARK